MAKRLVFVLAALICCRTFAPAQPAAGTLGENAALLSAVHDSMSQLAGLVKLAPEDSAELSRSLAAIDGSRRALAEAGGGAGYKTMLRAEGGDHWLGVANLMSAEPELFKALQFVKRTANDDTVDSLLAALGRPLLTAPVRELQESQLKASIQQSREKLVRYEKKYGPNSAGLNLAESAVNLFVLRGCRLFGTGENGPGPLEFISSYSSSYVSAVEAGSGKTLDDLGVFSAFELGLRCYFFGGNWGQGGCQGVLKPGYATAGLLVTGEAGGFFKWPLRGRESYGIFASWGGFKAGYTAGPDRRVLLSRQFQLVPYLF